uniref:RING-type E3 ubiquitin transferase n=4 Tax=Rhizophora mucronata TaxID=61149 RepID=A0A2P2JHD0_RHIMU
MAGMLPGVNCAPRRRFHLSRDPPGAAVHGWTRQSSLCCYRGNQETLSMQRSMLIKPLEDEKLGAKAREAKERLDEKLKVQRKSETKRDSGTGGRRNGNGRSMAPREIQTELFGPKNSGSKRFNWTKLNWKASEQDDCTICLERFTAGEHLVHLPCAHRFHTLCLVPWLENNAHCPCCRMQTHVQLS